MSDSSRFSGYHIQIGGEDLIDRYLHGILADDPENEDNKEKAEKKLLEILKEMRVRFGTLLKTDNVSFLIGAGASLDAGGVSLANIPIPLEGALIEKAAAGIEGDAAPSWLEFFYESVSLLSNDGYALKERSELFKSTQEKAFPAIAVNLEDYLSHLHMWLAGMVHETETLTLLGGAV
jgi:hypothetical protein